MTAFGEESYTYDANGNMASGDGRSITWDVENRPVSITRDGVTTDFVYDGDGNRVKKVVDDGQTVTTTLYINQYYEKTDTEDYEKTDTEVTTNYYLGSNLIAVKKDTTLTYIHQDSLTGTSVISDANGDAVASIKYFSFGSTRSSTGPLPTDKLFTGQRLDDTGLYYYGARYYDPNIGRFISPDISVPSIINSQAYNRYTYTLNNPVRNIDPSGLTTFAFGFIGTFEIGGIISVTANVGLVVDGSFHWGTLASSGAGGSLGGSGLGGIFFQSTNARSIQDLNGIDLNAGITVPVGIIPVGEVPVPVAVGGDLISSENGRYTGYQVNVGAGSGLSIHAEADKTTVQPFSGGNTKSADTTPSIPIDNTSPVVVADPKPASPPSVSSGSTTSVSTVSSSSNVYSNAVTGAAVVAIVGNNNIISNPATGSYAYSVSYAQNIALNAALGISMSTFSGYNW